jgi:hypothetical protein
MWKLATHDGRVAWYVGEDPDGAREMAAELFPGVGVEIREVGEDERP